MKVNELLGEFGIYTSRHEQTILDRLGYATKRYTEFNENEQFIIDSLVRKSLVQKINRGNITLIKKNGT